MKEYSFLDNILLINGYEISNYDEGEDVIQFGRLSDSASHKISVDGKMIVSLSASRAGFMKFKLSQVSAANAFMSGLVNMQENGMFVPVFAQMKDIRGGDFVSGTQGYIKRPSDGSRGATASSHEWEIIVERLDMILRPGDVF